jgi:hypothetical protein
MPFIAITAFIIAGLIMGFFVIVWGIAAASTLLLPVLTVASGLIILGFVLVVLPLSLFKHLRPRLALTSIIMSHVLGATTWMLSFLYVTQILGTIGILLAFMFQFLAPMALIALLGKGDWQATAALGLWIIFTYGIRYYGIWLMGGKRPNEPRPKERPYKDSVIDVEGKVIE